MALYAVTAGNVIQIADLNQFFDLLTGVMTGQEVTLEGGLRLDNLDTLYLLLTNSVGDSKRIRLNATTHKLELLNTAGSAVILALDDSGNMTVVGAVAASGAVSGTTGTFSGAVSGTTGTFTSSVESNSHPVVEGTTGQAAPLLNTSHIESYSDTTGTSIANSAETTRTITFSRAYGAAPAVFVSARTTATDSTNVSVGVDSVSTTGCTIRVRNTDAGTQTVYPMAVIVGA